MSFRNRVDAGRLLAKVLARYQDQRPVILASPRGGVPWRLPKRLPRCDVKSTTWRVSKYTSVSA